MPIAFGEGSQPSERNPGFRELSDGDAFHRLLVAAVTDYAIFVLDTQGYVRSWNAGAQRLKGYRADEIVGHHFSAFYTPEDIARGWPEQELHRARCGRQGRVVESRRAAHEGLHAR